jgi:hypothetical protein
VGQGTGDGCGGSGVSAWAARAKSISRKAFRASIGRMVIRPWLKRTLIVAGVLIVAGAVGWRALHLSEMAHIGAGYVAEQTCACVFVAARSQASCMGDLEPLAQKLVSFHVSADSVTATSFGFSTATAQYNKGFGCSLRD